MSERPRSPSSIEQKESRESRVISHIKKSMHAGITAAALVLPGQDSYAQTPDSSPPDISAQGQGQPSDLLKDRIRFLKRELDHDNSMIRSKAERQLMAINEAWIQRTNMHVPWHDLLTRDESDSAEVNFRLRRIMKDLRNLERPLAFLRGAECSLPGGSPSIGEVIDALNKVMPESKLDLSLDLLEKGISLRKANTGKMANATYWECVEELLRKNPDLTITSVDDRRVICRRSDFTETESFAVDGPIASKLRITEGRNKTQSFECKIFPEERFHILECYINNPEVSAQNGFYDLCIENYQTIGRDQQSFKISPYIYMAEAANIHMHLEMLIAPHVIKRISENEEFNKRYETFEMRIKQESFTDANDARVYSVLLSLYTPDRFENNISHGTTCTAYDAEGNVIKPKNTIIDAQYGDSAWYFSEKPSAVEVGYPDMDEAFCAEKQLTFRSIMMRQPGPEDEEASAKDEPQFHKLKLSK